jgi:hypothetical protein
MEIFLSIFLTSIAWIVGIGLWLHSVPLILCTIGGALIGLTVLSFVTVDNV